MRCTFILHLNAKFVVVIHNLRVNYCFSFSYGNLELGLVLITDIFVSTFSSKNNIFRLTQLCVFSIYFTGKNILLYISRIQAHFVFYMFCIWNKITLSLYFKINSVLVICKQISALFSLVLVIFLVLVES